MGKMNFQRFSKISWSLFKIISPDQIASGIVTLSRASNDKRHRKQLSNIRQQYLESLLLRN